MTPLLSRFFLRCRLVVRLSCRSLLPSSLHTKPLARAVEVTVLSFFMIGNLLLGVTRCCLHMHFPQLEKKTRSSLTTLRFSPSLVTSRTARSLEQGFVFLSECRREDVSFCRLLGRDPKYFRHLLPGPMDETSLSLYFPSFVILEDF